MKAIFLSLFILLTAAVPYAADEEHQRLAREVVKAVNVDGQVEMIMEKLKQLFEEKIGEINAAFGQNGDKESQRRSKRSVDTLVELFRKEVARQDIPGYYAKAYAEIYTTEELQELLKFYQSPLGKTIAEKNKTMLFREVEMVQKINDAMMPVLKTKAEELLKNMLMPPAAAPAPAKKRSAK
jgi:uncharacterized protein